MPSTVPGAKDSMELQILSLRDLKPNGEFVDSSVLTPASACLPGLPSTPPSLLLCHLKWGLQFLPISSPFMALTENKEIMGWLWICFSSLKESRLSSSIIRCRSYRYRKLIFTVQSVWLYFEVPVWFQTSMKALVFPFLPALSWRPCAKNNGHWHCKKGDR